MLQVYGFVHCIFTAEKCEIISSSVWSFSLISAERNECGCGRTSGPKFSARSRFVSRIFNGEFLRRRKRSVVNERVSTLLTFDTFNSAPFLFCFVLFCFVLFFLMKNFNC